LSSSDDDDSGEDVDEKEAKLDAADQDETTYEEIRGGVPYEHDIEASSPLEKKKSTRSVKDPNLVWSAQQLSTATAIADMYKVTWDSEFDPYNPKNCKLRVPCEVQTNHSLTVYRVHEAEMGSDIHCFFLYSRLANILVYDITGSEQHKCRIRNHK
jgi:hypothetical protein